MKLIRRWPAVLTPHQYIVARLLLGCALLLSIGLWFNLLLHWNEIGALYKVVSLAYLALVSPSVPEVFQSYDSYAREQTRLFGAADARNRSAGRRSY